MVGKRIISGILVFCIFSGCFLCGNFFSHTFAINIRENEAGRRNLLERNESLRNSLRETKSKINEKQKYKDNLNQQIVKLGKEINSLTNDIAELDADILQKQNEIVEKQKLIEEKYKRLKKSIVAVYKAGDVHTIDIILSANSFSDFIDKAQIIGKMNAYNQRIISEINEQVSAISEKKSAIEQKRSLVSKQKVTLASRKKEHALLLEKTQATIKELETEQAKVQGFIDENNAEYKRMEREAERYYEEQARKMRENGGKSYINYSSGKKYLWPVPFTTRISSPYGERRGNVTHGGIDIASRGVYGKPVLAADSGIVYACHKGCCHDYGKSRSCGCGGGYGNYVMIDHGNGKMTIYGHLSRVNVSDKQKIVRGEIIGAVGTTGYSTGAHLHFETRLFNRRYNPMTEY